MNDQPQRPPGDPSTTGDGQTCLTASAADRTSNRTLRRSLFALRSMVDTPARLLAFA